MRQTIIATACAAAACLVACSPALNWRETPITGTSLTGLFPCKPQKTSRTAALGGSDVPVVMASCDAGDATFAVGHAHLADPSLVGPVLLQWRMAALNGMQAKEVSTAAWVPEHALNIPQSVHLTAVGSAPDGRALGLRATWFARGSDVFAALVYTRAPAAEAAETFLAGFKFR